MFLRIFLIVLIFLLSINAERINPRGDGLITTISSNTYGKNNILIKTFGRAYYWDDAGIDPITGEGSNYPLKVLPSLGVDYGILPYLDCGLSIEAVGRSFTLASEITARIKGTLPTNSKLRFYGLALDIEYKYNRVANFGSIGGYREGGTGFSADGIMYEGSSLKFIIANDLDLISIDSKLPIRVLLNTGYLMSLNRTFSYLDQIVLSLGLEYKGINSDFFLETGLKTLSLFDASTRIEELDNGLHIFTVHFLENYIYFTPGIRLKFENGVVFTGGFPLSLAKEVGEDIHAIPNQSPIRSTFFRDEGTDGFSPFYADWQINGKITIPIKFKTTTSEMVRNYLLLKNIKHIKKRSIEEKLNKNDTDSEKRLIELEEKKKKIQEENLLE